jgi:hypothetical protein
LADCTSKSSSSNSRMSLPSGSSVKRGWTLIWDCSPTYIKGIVMSKAENSVLLWIFVDCFFVIGLRRRRFVGILENLVVF